MVKPRHLTTRATVWVSRAHLHRLREGGGRQREAEQTVQPSALALKGETDRREGKASRAFPPVSYERAKAVVERETQKGTRKRYEHFRRSLKRGTKTVKRERKKHATEMCTENKKHPAGDANVKCRARMDLGTHYCYMQGCYWFCSVRSLAQGA